MEQVDKQTVENVQRYFEKKIEDCDFEVISFTSQNNGFSHFSVKVDGDYDFSFGVSLFSKMIAPHRIGSFMNITVKNLENLIPLTERYIILEKEAKIKEMKEKLKELENDK